MTIVTKPLSEKKVEKPLVGETKVDIVPERTGHQDTPFVRTKDYPDHIRGRRAHSASTGCLFLTALMVMSCGIVTGLYLYKQYVRVRMDKFHLRCSIPYGLQSGLQRIGDLSVEENLESDLALNNELYPEKKYFHEDFEIDDSYEKISVPDFSGGRKSKFIHDFNMNKTGIIDIEGHRCFVMPLNHTLILPPKSLMDLLKKMKDGYYEVDTGILRETMQVVTPAIEDRASLGLYIERECFGYPIYKLEKIVTGVYKRSAEPEVKFMEFAGKNTLELHIINYKELQEHEVLMPVAMA